MIRSPTFVRDRVDDASRPVGNMKQNLGFAFAYNAVGVPIAAGVLYPVFGLLLSPMVAALAMSLSSVSVVANALRLQVDRRTVLADHICAAPAPAPGQGLTWINCIGSGKR